jgi:deazaflavin-dependent oxidoreductase (nitroreductase family)
MESRFFRRVFKVFNRWVMVPLFRLGLGPLVGNPLTGYIMVLKTTGRKTGLTRYAPVNYAIIEGNVYCTAGFGKRSHWYRNLKAHPGLEVMLPGRTIQGPAEEVEDLEEKLTAFRQIMKNGGVAGFSLGFNPYTVSDEALKKKAVDYPVLRIRPTGLGSGAGDPGGWMWGLWVGVMLGLMIRRKKQDRKT